MTNLTKTKRPTMTKKNMKKKMMKKKKMIQIKKNKIGRHLPKYSNTCRSLKLQDPSKR